MTRGVDDDVERAADPAYRLGHRDRIGHIEWKRLDAGQAQDGIVCITHRRGAGQAGNHQARARSGQCADQRAANRLAGIADEDSCPCYRHHESAPLGIGGHAGGSLFRVWHLGGIAGKGEQRCIAATVEHQPHRDARAGLQPSRKVRQHDRAGIELDRAHVPR
ncbi:hypothetical protein ACFS32_04210 [Novosphingobium pokkalii]|uniref:hypothetical protein n=1 Tax=Novosphingobium pokkalii TaxID=1770194 RepID=UPI0036337D0F